MRSAYLLAIATVDVETAYKWHYTLCIGMGREIETPKTPAWLLE